MDSVAAVVVTYNRKELLRENLDALLAQTNEITYIILIDNSSTDGTEDMIKEKYSRCTKILYIRLKKNVGGAGGFYNGIKYAHENLKVDWIWLMDDDTVPEKTALEKLLSAKNSLPGGISYLASTVLGMEREPMNVPAVDLSPDQNGYPSWYMELEKKCVKITNATFVSILVRAKAVPKIGYPIPWYFLWGDDTEYTLRLTKYYGNAYLVGDSKVIHKRKNGKSLSIFEEDDPDRIHNYYYYYRNAVLNYMEYFGKRATMTIIWSWEKNLIKALFGRKKMLLKKCRIIHKAIFDAICNNKQRTAFLSRMKV